MIFLVVVSHCILLLIALFGKPVESLVCMISQQENGHTDV